MAERVPLTDLPMVVSKAVADILHNKTLGHGPIICGFVAPEALAAAEAEKIAAAVAKAVPGTKATSGAIGEQAGAKTPGLPHRPIIVGIVIESRTHT